MLITLYRQFVARSLDLIITNRFKTFLPHSQILPADKLARVRELNAQFYTEAMTNLVGGAIMEARMRIPVLDQISVALAGMLGVGAVALMLSLIWTGVTAVCMPMILVALGMLFYVLSQGKDLIKTFSESMLTNDLQKMAAGQSVLFIVRLIGVVILLMGTITVAHPFMWLLLIAGIAYVLFAQYMDMTRLMLHLESKDIDRTELDAFVKATAPLYSFWALSQFEDSMDRGLRLSLKMIQRYQFHTDSAAD